MSYQFEIELKLKEENEKTITCRVFARSDYELFRKLDDQFGKGAYIPGPTSRRWVGSWERIN